MFKGFFKFIVFLNIILCLVYSFYVKVSHIEGTGAADVDAVDAHEGIYNGLTAI